LKKCKEFIEKQMDNTLREGFYKKNEFYFYFIFSLYPINLSIEKRKEFIEIKIKLIIAWERGFAKIKKKII